MQTFNLRKLIYCPINILLIYVQLKKSFFQNLKENICKRKENGNWILIYVELCIERVFYKSKVFIYFNELREMQFTQIDFGVKSSGNFSEWMAWCARYGHFELAFLEYFHYWALYLQCSRMDRWEDINRTTVILLWYISSLHYDKVTLYGIYIHIVHSFT